MQLQLVKGTRAGENGLYRNENDNEIAQLRNIEHGQEDQYSFTMMTV